MFTWCTDDFLTFPTQDACPDAQLQSQDNLSSTSSPPPQVNPLIIDPLLETPPPPGDPHDEFGIGTIPEYEGLNTLQPSQTLVIYHPFAQHPPEVIDTAKLTLTWESSLPPPSEDPYTLFSTCDDFEQAEIFICHNCTNMMINNQLQLNQKAPQAGEQCPQSMKNACEMHKILAEAGEYQDTSLVILLHHLHRFMVLMPKCSLQVWRYLSHIHMAMRRTGPILCTVIQQWKQYWMPLKILIFTHHSYSILNGTIS